MSLSHCQLAFQPRIKHYTNLPNCPLSRQPTKGTKPSRSTRQQKLPTNCLYNCRNESQAPRIFAVSDLHTDYSENMKWVKGLSTSWYKNDVLIVAGDVAETYSNFLVTMSELKERFRFIFFVPGNHDLWCRREGDRFIDSLEKLNALLDACSDLGVETSPRIVEGLGIIPLFSWYHKSFDTEKDITRVRIPSLEMACKDFHACKWPAQLDDDISLANYFDKMNESNTSFMEEILRSSSQLITFSHFVPRYIQSPLAYPRERKRRMNGGEDWLPFCIYHEGFTDTLSPSYWSDYYSKNKRDPENTELAPWVARFYER
ncbi:uncharacterized protein LOC109826195 isoform X2 [Asparagus officinalis]|uniref:uncharacterized protein LOC109826195 isoform X2 n=1 Tax=Asparagus officinalis TaxID=4686 RepID=UPI00098E36FA|nr:uncharacterized protein LOC109826195 isoform X2 [Asparagus officinalis]